MSNFNWKITELKLCKENERVVTDKSQFKQDVQFLTKIIEQMRDKDSKSIS